MKMLVKKGERMAGYGERSGSRDYQKRRYMTAERKFTTFHWFQVYAIKNQVNSGKPMLYSCMCVLPLGAMHVIIINHNTGMETT